MLELNDAVNTLLDWRHKGLPPSADPVKLEWIGELGLNILREDMSLPVALLKRSAIEHNRRWMRDFVAMTGTQLCPHGKTTMAPQLFARQIEDGAWGMTAATISHVRTYRQAGVRRILLANQLIGPADIRYILNEISSDPSFDFYCLIDSAEGLRRLAEGQRATPAGRPVQVLLEVGLPGGRTGVRDAEQALALARQAAGTPGIALRGVEVYEGIAPGNADEAEERIRAVLLRTEALARQFAQEDLFAHGQIIVSAGGSAYFDLAARLRVDFGCDQRVQVVLRSGCYLTHDDRFYADYFRRIAYRMPATAVLGEGLQPALQLCAYLQSLPEPGLGIAGFGKRDASHDVHLPTPLWWFRPGLHTAPQPLPGALAVTAMNDQHAYLRLPPEHELQVGDVLGFGISHPCTTFDKWSVLYEVDDGYNVVGAVKTYF